MAIEESLVVKGVLEGLKSGTQDGCITTLERFVNEFATDMTVEELVEEAKSDVRKTRARLL